MARKGLNKSQQESTDSAELSQSQITAVAAIISGCTVTGAASRAGIDRSTIYLWLKQDAAFVAELNRAKLEQLQVVKDELRALAVDATRTLRDLLTASETPPTIRLRAAVVVLQAVGGLEPEKIGPTDAGEVQYNLTMFKL
jgi:hypothetical protein